MHKKFYTTNSEIISANCVLLQTSKHREEVVALMNHKSVGPDLFCSMLKNSIYLMYYMDTFAVGIKSPPQWVVILSKEHYYFYTIAIPHDIYETFNQWYIIWIHWKIWKRKNKMNFINATLQTLSPHYVCSCLVLKWWQRFWPLTVQCRKINFQ